MLINQVPNLNQYPTNPHDERFGFLPFVGGLAVGALAGGFGGGARPCCGPMWGPSMMQPQFIPVQTLPAPIAFQQFQPMQPPFQNQVFIR